MTTPFLTIGTRGSPLALAQAHEVRAALASAAGCPLHDIAIRTIKTTGDSILSRPLADIGGKGLFTKEIEDGLLQGSIDLAVHSAKDMPTRLPEGLHLSACLEREDVRDAFISLVASTPEDLPEGATVGTSSLRREAQLRRLRPDLRIVPLRGNIQTRLNRLHQGEISATLLAVAGLNRLHQKQQITCILPVTTMLPAVAQGAIAIETRENDTRIQPLLAAINHDDTLKAITLERIFLACLEGSCRTPIAGYAQIMPHEMKFAGKILSPDGQLCEEISFSAPLDEAEQRITQESLALKARTKIRFS